MFCPYKNSYLQLVCAINPKVINRAVDVAMRRKDPVTSEDPPQGQNLDSMQPSLYCPNVDITRANVGFGRIGLRVLNRDLHSTDSLVQLQAVHSIMDEVQISEKAIFLINLNVVYRLIDLITHENPIIREKVCMTLTHLVSYAQGKERIATRPVLIENLMSLILNDRKEIRYAAANTMRTLSSDRNVCDMILKNETVVFDLLKMTKDDHHATTVLHLETIANLTECNAEPALRANGFQIMRKLFHFENKRIVTGAMNVMMQMCKHEVGKSLADVHDMTYKLRRYLTSPHVQVCISAVGILEFTTLTTRSRWRAKQICNELTKRLVSLCSSSNFPQLQLKCMQVLINLCDCPDIRRHVRANWDAEIRDIKIKTHLQWDGSSKTESRGLKTGHNYRTVYIEGVESIENDFGDNTGALNVHSYLGRLQELKDRLIKAYTFVSYKD